MFQVLVAALLAGLTALLPRILAGVGVFFISNTVSAPIFDWMQSQIFSFSSTLPADVLNAVKFAGIFDAVIIIITAYTTVLAIKAGKAAFMAK